LAERTHSADRSQFGKTNPIGQNEANWAGDYSFTSVSLALENQIRGILKTFGRIPRGLADHSKRTFAPRSRMMPRLLQSSYRFFKRDRWLGANAPR
jgi:hypothetical protein